MLIGAVVAGALTLTGNSTVYGIHGGTIGLALNFVICVVGSLVFSPSEETQRDIEEMTRLEKVAR